MKMADYESNGGSFVAFLVKYIPFNLYFIYNSVSDVINYVFFVIIIIIIDFIMVVKLKRTLGDKLKWYDKETKSEKLWEIGETPDETKYTKFKPIEEESHQKLTTNGWIIDTEAKVLADKRKQKSQILAQVNLDLENGIEYIVNGVSHIFQATKDSITDMNNLASDVEFLGSTWIGFWRSKENIKVNMTYIQFKEMAKIASELYKQKFTESRISGC